MTIKIKNSKALQNALNSRISAMSENSPVKNRALNRIGMLVSNRAKLNARNKRIIDTGALLNSLQYRIGNNSVTVGSFGVLYAKFHEFGADLHPAAIRAMFAAMRKRGTVGRPGKGVLRFSGAGDQLRAKLTPRPFLVPALEQSKTQIISIVQQELFGAR